MKFIEPLDMIYENIKNKINMHFMFCIMPGILCFDTSGFYSPYYDIVRIIEEEKKKHLSFIQRHKLSKNMQSGADVDVNVAKK